MRILSKDALSLFIGIIGAIIILVGLTNAVEQPYFIIGAVLLLTTAIHFRLTYFVALQIILIAGHGAILLGIGPISQIILPILLCGQLLIYYMLSGQLNHIFRFIGICGIALLSIGFSFQNQWVFFFGSLSVGTFSIYQVVKGRQIALLWVILNMLIAIIALIKIIF